MPKKDDAIVELTLPEKENIYASEYRLYLPDKTLLQRKLAEWVEAFEEEQTLRQAGKEPKPLELVKPDQPPNPADGE